MADVSGYDPKRSRVSDETMNIFQKGKITGDLTDIPGIGPAAVKKLRAIEPEEEKITNTFQLIGKFLMLKGPNDDEHKVETREHLDKFWYFLSDINISSHRSGIVKAIAEKVNQMMPGIYDAAEYDEDSESDEDEVKEDDGDAVKE